MEGKIDSKIDNWKKKLLDLSKRNDMINFREKKTKSLPIVNNPSRIGFTWIRL